MQIRTTALRSRDGEFLYNQPENSNIQTLSLHDALPIYLAKMKDKAIVGNIGHFDNEIDMAGLKKIKGIKRTNIKPQYDIDRKSTRLNSSHVAISYAVFCLKKINGIQSLLERLKQQPNIA